MKNKLPQPAAIKRLPWTEISVVGGIIVLLLAILLPAVQNARNSARHLQSKHNLRSLAIALANYHSTSRVFPIGGDVDETDTAKHGWMTRCLPYLDANPYYSWLDQDFSWNAPVNQWIFQRPYPCGLNPGISESVTADGLGLLHYMGNPNVLHRNSSVSLSDMTAGAANTWLVAEINNNFQPWGYPFNWCPLQHPLGSNNNSFGRPGGDGASFCMADGSVRFYSADTDPDIVSRLASTPPLAAFEATVVPEPDFKSPFAGGAEEITLLEEDDSMWRCGLAIGVFLDADGTELTAHFRTTGKGSGPPETYRHVQWLQMKYPGIKTLIARRWSISDGGTQLLQRFPLLESLHVADINLSATGRQHLQKLPKLHTITVSEVTSKEQEINIVRTLPGCRIHVRRQTY